MANWLLKTEPGSYSFADLQNEGTAIWDGVTSNFALKFMREMKKGDRAMIYHTGKEKRIVGLADVVSGPYPDPALDDEKRIVVDVKAGKLLNGVVTLKSLRMLPEFSEFMLLRNSRLSIIPVPDDLWSRLLELDAA